MGIVVASSSKARAVAPKHARRCVTSAISNISAQEKVELSWVIIYFPDHDYLGQDGVPSPPQLHCTVRGFSHFIRAVIATSFLLTISEHSTAFVIHYGASIGLIIQLQACPTPEAVQVSSKLFLTKSWGIP
jgi:hypothetical protein